MPTYDYHCSACGHEFSRMLKIDNRKDPVGQECPECFSEGTVGMAVSSPMITSGVGDLVSKTPQSFKDKLRDIKEFAGKSSTIDV